MLEGWYMIRPMLLAFTVHHTKNTIVAATGITIIFTTKKITDFVNREPYQRKQYEPEQEETHEVSSVYPRRGWH